MVPDSPQLTGGQVLSCFNLTSIIIFFSNTGFIFSPLQVDPPQSSALQSSSTSSKDFLLTLCTEIAGLDLSNIMQEKSAMKAQLPCNYTSVITLKLSFSPPLFAFCLFNVFLSLILSINPPLSYSSILRQSGV